MTKKTPENTENKNIDKEAKKTESVSSKQDSTAPAKKVDTNKPVSEPSVSPKKAVTTEKKSGLYGFFQFFLLALIVLVAAGLWYQYQSSEKLAANLHKQLQTESNQAKQALEQAKQTAEALNKQNQKINELVRELADSKAELNSLNTAFQLITDRGSDLVLINDIEHMVTIAQQQLQLSGNVANAIISLEAAQAQLARANRPSLASLQQTINGDLDRLRVASTVDIALLSARLDELAGLVLQAPLLVPDDAVPSTDSLNEESIASQEIKQTPSADSNSSLQNASASKKWWESAIDTAGGWAETAITTLRHDLGQFVSVRRVDDATALFISPDQATRFRDNLRLRIMISQLALMMGQSQVWEAETTSILQAIESRFDQKYSLTRKAIRIAREVADTSIEVSLPTVNNTIKAIEALHERRANETPNSETNNESDTSEN